MTVSYLDILTVLTLERNLQYLHSYRILRVKDVISLWEEMMEALKKPTALETEKTFVDILTKVENRVIVQACLNCHGKYLGQVNREIFSKMFMEKPTESCEINK